MPSPSRNVPAGNGWSWIAEAWTLFMRNPLMWIVITVIFLVIFVILHFIPVIGMPAAMVLTPVFVGGVMLGTRALDQNGELTPGHLFAGFQQRFGALATIGAAYFAAVLVISLLVGLGTGGKLFELFAGGDVDPAKVLEMASTLMLAMLLMLALLLPVFMALWFAPALVLLQDRAPMAALGESFAACLKNMIPFLVYGIVLLVLSIPASLLFGLGWLLLGPVTLASVYTSYRDIWPTSSPPARPEGTGSTPA